MKLRNINISTLILLALLFSSCAFFVTAQENTATQNNVFMDSDQDGLTDSEEHIYGTDAHNPDTDGDGYSDGAEVAAGYDPLKMAPGDKLTTAPDTTSNQEASTNEEDATNLTQHLAQKISTITAQTDPENQSNSLGDVQQLVDDTLTSQDNSFELPQIARDTIKIKKQDYKKSQEKEKKKEDFSNYIATVFYIFTSNSPSPITSSSDITSVLSQTTQKIISAISTQDSTDLNSLSKSGEAILEQLKEVEVPEDLVDLHIKAMQYALYAVSLKDLVKSNSNDPVLDIVNLSRIGAFVQSLSSFSSDAQSKLDEYDVSYDDIQNKMKDMGVELPGLDTLSNITSTSKN